MDIILVAIIFLVLALAGYITLERRDKAIINKRLDRSRGARHHFSRRAYLEKVRKENEEKYLAGKKKFEYQEKIKKSPLGRFE